MTAGRAAFERAVAAYRLDDLEPPAGALNTAAASLERTGLFLLGEVHGVEQTPRAILTLVRRLGVRALALEWSWDELDAVVQPVLSTGRVDRDALWSLPATAEVFGGDGRFTAGHVRMLEALAGELEQIVLLDRVAAEGVEREAGMAERLASERRRGAPTLAVLGVAHVLREPRGEAETLAARFPGVANGVLAPSAGTCWFHGEREVTQEAFAVDAVLPLGPATPATVPLHM